MSVTGSGFFLSTMRRRTQCSHQSEGVANPPSGNVLFAERLHSPFTKGGWRSGCKSEKIIRGICQTCRETDNDHLHHTLKLFTFNLCTTCLTTKTSKHFPGSYGTTPHQAKYCYGKDFVQVT
jgi:hypothetical protein